MSKEMLIVVLKNRNIEVGDGILPYYMTGAVTDNSIETSAFYLDGDFYWNQGFKEMKKNPHGKIPMDDFISYEIVNKKFIDSVYKKLYEMMKNRMGDLFNGASFNKGFMIMLDTHVKKMMGRLVRAEKTILENGIRREAEKKEEGLLEEVEMMMDESAYFDLKDTYESVMDKIKYINESSEKKLYSYDVPNTTYLLLH